MTATETDVRTLLHTLPLFARLGEGALDAVERRVVTRRVAAETLLFRHGEPCKGLYAIVEGQVRVYRSSADGREQVIHTLGPGRPVAEVPLFDGGPYPASARTTEPTRLLFLPLADFQWLYRSEPEIADAVIHELGRRLRRMVGLVEKISLRDVPARVATTLLEYAAAVGELRDGAEFPLPRTQEELAAELATTRESVARALSRLRAERIIEQSGGTVRVLDAARLEAAATGEPAATPQRKSSR
jgi:CRP/FNR family transcriptional regulator